MKNDYLYTSIHKSAKDLVLEEDTTYIYGRSLEERSHFVDELISFGFKNVHFLKLDGPTDEQVTDSDTNKQYFLRSNTNVQEIINKYSSKNICIDVTGLDNRICAALIKNSIDLCNKGLINDVKMVYAEPGVYDIKEFKTESVFNDLSEKIEGISPLPGFASIVPQDEEDVVMIALIGFEGGRFSHMLEAVQPPQVIPVIGVPGFRLEYPFVTYWGNKRPLEESETWRKIKFAAANSIVEVYTLLTKILKKNPEYKIKLAPIGTKPHAIAAMLFAIKNPKAVELVYDNPKRKKKRTTGIGNILECSISRLISEN